ncbi:hypothetical protein [Candidatus Binatus sp.]|uniref:hypothetical protein n=1 Tax=Candidatus Binatus sp. TaxID=2811406 RepID=UPI003BAF2B4D
MNGGRECTGVTTDFLGLTSVFCDLLLLFARNRFERCRPSLSPTRLHSAANFDRRASNHSRLFAGAFVFLPGQDQSPQATWIDSQGIADVLERERSVCLVMENPEPSFPEFLSFDWIFRFEVALKSSHRISQDAAHQAHYRLDLSRPAPRRIELRGHNSISPEFVACRICRRFDSHNCIVHG